MNKVINVIIGIIIIGIVAGLSGLLGIVGSTLYYEPQLAEAQLKINALERDVQKAKKDIRAEGARHLQSRNNMLVEINRLENLDADWEFYHGAYGACYRIAGAGGDWSQERINQLCNRLIKEWHNEKMHQWKGPPGIDKPFIEGKAELESG